MNVKEFFKPNWLKAIIWCVFFIISFTYGIMLGFSRGFSNIFQEIIAYIFSYVPFILAMLVPESIDLGSLYLLIILSVIYAYILSCAAAFLINIIYMKIKKSK